MQQPVVAGRWGSSFFTQKEYRVNNAKVNLAWKSRTIARMRWGYAHNGISCLRQRPRAPATLVSLLPRTIRVDYEPAMVAHGCEPVPACTAQLARGSARELYLCLRGPFRLGRDGLFTHDTRHSHN